MKILIVVDTMAIGGAEKLTTTLAKHFVDYGQDCRVLVLKGDFASTVHLDRRVRVCTALRRFKLDVSYIFKIRGIIAEYKPDLILCQAVFAYFSVKAAKLFLPRIATFLALHYTYNAKLKDDFFDLLYYNILRFWSDSMITIYKKQAIYFSGKYHIPIRRFNCIYNGIDTDFYKCSRKDNDGIFDIVHIANIREEKDQITLLKALKIFNDRFKDWRLTFCGVDHINGKQKLVDYLSDANLSGKVKFVDRVDDVRQLLGYADVFVLSSISEALPMSALEAMSMGVPCILTDVGGCSEIVDNGINGFIVESRNPKAIAEKLIFLAENRCFLKKMRRKAREKVIAAFSIRRMVEAYLCLFNVSLRKELVK